MIDFNNIMVVSTNDYEPSEEDERDFWNGEGHLIFKVTANRKGDPDLFKKPTTDVFEIEIEEYSGCLGGFSEGCGIEWGLKEGYLNIAREDLFEGYIYYCTEITVSWTRGDGWMTEDDSEYYVGDMCSERLPLIPYLKLKLHNVWWFNIGWKIQEWRNKWS